MQVQFISKLSFSYHYSQCLTAKAKDAGMSKIRIEYHKIIRSFRQGSSIAYL